MYLYHLWLEGLKVNYYQYNDYFFYSSNYYTCPSIDSLSFENLKNTNNSHNLEISEVYYIESNLNLNKFLIKLNFNFIKKNQF